MNCTFFIHKNENKTSIQPILKLNIIIIIIMFNNIFCEVKALKGKKVIHWGLGEWGNYPNYILEV